MTDAPNNVINMQARARLIREAREARGKRKAERLWVSSSADYTNWKPDKDVGSVTFPGGADVRLMTASEREAMERATAEIDAEAKELLRERGPSFQYQPKHRPDGAPAFPGGIDDLEV